jgi:hypothetical protein
MEDEKEPIPDNINEPIPDIIKRRFIVSRWEKFLRDKESTELWTKKDFLSFLENEENILNYTWVMGDGKMVLLKTNENLKSEYKQKLDRLRDIYNQRFNNVDTDIDLSEYLKTAPTKVLFMYELGIFDYLIERYPELKINQTLLCNVISVFSGMKTDTIRKPYAALLLGEKDTSDYNFKSEKNQNALNDVFKKLGLERNKKLKGG